MPRNRKPRKPCEGCGGDKGEGVGRIYCPACLEVMPALVREADLARSRKPCRDCGAPKGPGQRGRQLCDLCQPGAAERKRVRDLKAKREKRATEEGRQEAVAASREYRSEHSQEGDKKRKREYRAEQKRKREERAEKLGLRYGVRVPSAPLGEAIREMARRETCSNPLAPPVLRDTDRLYVVCNRAGIVERSLFAWGSGERPQINLYKAIEILDRLDLMWWEVWTEKSVPDPWAFERARLLFEATSDAELKAAAFMPRGVSTGPDAEFAAAA